MKTIASLLVLFIISLLGFAQNTNTKETISITVSVPNVPGTHGKVYFGLYNESTFMKAAPLMTEEASILKGIAKITFTNVPAGEYAISCFYDKNTNKRMDFEPNGMPKESYGVSNNDMSYGPPQWQTAKFSVTDTDLEMVIRM